jgi:hypothetical protein
MLPGSLGRHSTPGYASRTLPEREEVRDDAVCRVIEVQRTASN